MLLKWLWSLTPKQTLENNIGHVGKSLINEDNFITAWALLTHSSSVPGSIQSSVYCLCGVLHSRSIYMGFLSVLQFPPSSYKHSVVKMGILNCPKRVNGCLHGAWWWPCITSRMYSGFTSCVPKDRIPIHRRMKQLLKMNEWLKEIHSKTWS